MSQIYPQRDTSMYMRTQDDGWKDINEGKTTTYQFGALLSRCHSCETRQRKEKEKGRRLPMAS